MTLKEIEHVRKVIKRIKPPTEETIEILRMLVREEKRWLEVRESRRDEMAEANTVQW